MQSIWSKSCHLRKREPLNKALETEVAIIGAGMAGCLTAYLLQEAGLHVTVLESNRIGSGQTGNTTAKVTAQHGLFYQKLIASFGEERARQYAQVNQAAIGEYERVITGLDIDCDWERLDAYVYGNETDTLRAEAEAAARLDLPAVYTTYFSLPLLTSGAVKFRNQAQFHPLKFLKGVSEQLTVYEHTPVQRLEGNQLVTPHGCVRAEKVVFATHFPFVNFPGFYFARMHQERSYVLALKNAPKLAGMFIGAGKKDHSLRTYGDLLLFGGESHRTGERPEGGCYQAL